MPGRKIHDIELKPVKKSTTCVVCSRNAENIATVIKFDKSQVGSTVKKSLNRIETSQTFQLKNFTSEEHHICDVCVKKKTAVKWTFTAVFSLLFSLFISPFFGLIVSGVYLLIISPDVHDKPIVTVGICGGIIMFILILSWTFLFPLYEEITLYRRQPDQFFSRIAANYLTRFNSKYNRGIFTTIEYRAPFDFEKLIISLQKSD